MGLAAEARRRRPLGGRQPQRGTGVGEDAAMQGQGRLAGLRRLEKGVRRARRRRAEAVRSGRGRRGADRQQHAHGGQGSQHGRPERHMADDGWRIVPQRSLQHPERRHDAKERHGPAAPHVEVVQPSRGDDHHHREQAQPAAQRRQGLARRQVQHHSGQRDNPTGQHDPAEVEGVGPPAKSESHATPPRHDCSIFVPSARSVKLPLQMV